MSEKQEAQGRYYLLVSSLQEMIPPEETVSTVELDEIDQIRKMVEEVSTDRPQFFTTT